MHAYNGSSPVELYFFHIRDDSGVVEDPDGIELPDMAALLAEVIRRFSELSREASTHPSMRFEIADANGRTVLIAPMQGDMASWDLIAELPVEQASMQ